MISEVSERVSHKTISNCFRHAAFKQLLIVFSHDVNDDDDLNDENLRPALSATEAEQFVDLQFVHELRKTILSKNFKKKMANTKRFTRRTIYIDDFE